MKAIIYTKYLRPAKNKTLLIGKVMHKHLPRFVENSTIFRFLFLVRKLFFIKSSRGYYSIYGEDISLGHIIDLRKRGTYVDVGCFHPKKYSNTYRLYKFGWSGINIDMDEIKIKGFNWLRRRDINICAAITDNPDLEYMTMYSFGFYTLNSSLNREVAEKRGNYIEKKVRCSTLNKILQENNISRVDLLSIDAEGHDLNVLRSISLADYKVHTIIIESDIRYLADLIESELYQYVTSQGYSLVNWTGPSLFFQQKRAKQGSSP